MDSFSFKLKITKTEKSKDSSSRYETWELIDNILRYEKRYSMGGFKNKPPMELNKKITTEALNKLLDSIKTKKFHLSINPNKTDNFKPPYITTLLNWEFNYYNELISIELYDLASNMESNNLFNEFLNFSVQLTSLLKEQ